MRPMWTNLPFNHFLGLKKKRLYSVCPASELQDWGTEELLLLISIF